MKILFAPVGLLAGLVAGVAAKKAIERIWATAADREPPQPEDRDVPLAQLAVALMLEGAVFRLAKGLADRGARQGFAGATGVWPGEKKPEPQ